MDKYPEGNREILKSIKDGSFDEDYADIFLLNVDLNEPISDLSGFSTTYLFEAVEANNLPAVSYLLKRGADPNFCNIELDGDCPLWSLQYIYEDQDLKTRYEIQKLFFKYGADPNLESEDEILYDYVVFKVYNITPVDEDDWENLSNFYKLLVAYGGGSNKKGHYAKPDTSDIDLDRIDDYEVDLKWHDDGIHVVGKLIDPDGNEISRL